MKHFISFQKKKGLFLAKGEDSNTSLVHQINHELMNYGFILSKELFDVLVTQTKTELEKVYDDVVGNITKITGGGGYEPIYTNFPQSVIALDYEQFLVNAIIHYWSFGTWRPTDESTINRTLAFEGVNFTEVKLISEFDYNSIFTNLVYSKNSLSSFDKEVVDMFITNGVNVDLNRITFKETLAYVGKKLLDSEELTVLPTTNATDVLRIYSVYCGGDEGLKENTRFKNPSATQRKVLLNTLNKCNNLEDSFKTYREKWLRVLYFLHPMTPKNKKSFRNVYIYTDLLRNSPKSLRTFNSRVEELIENKDEDIFKLLKSRKGVFTRRLDHLVRTFGTKTIDQWLNCNVDLIDLYTAYNHFYGRDDDQVGRSAILANSSQSQVVTYKSLEPLKTEVVNEVRTKIKENLSKFKNVNLKGKKVFIDRSLYYTPFDMNNRASSLSLSGVPTGKCVKVEKGKTIRAFVHWHGSHDIDLSGMVIRKDNIVAKVGWNGNHHYKESIIYSGDNTGYSSKNAEYLDIDTSKLPDDVEWVIVDATIYRGPSKYSDWSEPVRTGFMLRDKPESNDHWLPKTLEQSMVLNSSSKSAYLIAYHAPSNTMMYLDVTKSQSNVTTVEDAVVMRSFLDKHLVIDDGTDEISWDKLNQGHILNLLSEEVVNDSKDADIVFDEHTPTEEILSLV